MKIKKVLCSVLAAVMAASVLSVGMVTSAMAAATTTPDASTGYPTATVNVPGEYPLNSSTMPTAQGQAVSDYDPDNTHSLQGHLKYLNLNAVDASFVKVQKDGWISFNVSSASIGEDGTGIWLSVLMGSDTGANKATLYKEDGTAVKAVGSTSEDGTGEITGTKNIKYHLTEAGKYFINGDTKDSVSIEELEFTKSEPTVDILGAKAKGGSTDSGQNIAIFKDNKGTSEQTEDDVYYAVVLFTDVNVSGSKAYKNFTLTNESTVESDTTNTDTKELTTVYKEIEVNNVRYDANYFGTGTYMYPVKLSSTNYTQFDGDDASVSTAKNAAIFFSKK